MMLPLRIMMWLNIQTGILPVLCLIVTHFFLQWVLIVSSFLLYDRAETVVDRSTHVEKTQNMLHDQRAIKRPEKKEQRVEAERGNVQRRNWRGDNRRNARETERQQVFERQPSPETWRKPAEEPKSSSDIANRHNKAASAVELAQAFSRSVSDSKTNDRFSGQKGLNTGRTQIPFSRLVGPPARPQINGY